MAKKPEQSEYKQFPEEFQGWFWYLYILGIERIIPDACQISMNSESEVRLYLEAHVHPALHRLGAVLTYYDEDLYYGKIGRVFYITHFEKKVVPEIRNILKTNGITWPM